MPNINNEPHKVNVTPEQKQLLETMNYEDQQKFLQGIRAKQGMNQKQEIDKKEIDNKKEVLSEDKIKEIKGSAIEELKNSIKEPIVISLIAFIFSIPQLNNLFLSTKSNIFVNDNTGDITIISLLIKALLVGIIYYFIKKYNIV